MSEGKSRKRPVKSWKASLSGKNKYLDKVLNDSHFRILMTSAFGGGWNFIYALFHLVLALVFRSFWFLTMGVYYLTVCGMRASALRLEKGAGNRRTERRALKRNAFLTFVLAFIFSGVVCLTILEKRNNVYDSIVAIAMAAFTFYCVVTAILNLAHLKKERTVQKIMLRNCSMVCALGSLFGLERTLLGTFGGGDSHFILVMEEASGTGFFILIVFFGINLLIMASRTRHKH